MRPEEEVVERMLDGLEKRPGMYGSQLETIEFTWLALMHVRKAMVDPTGEDNVGKAWHRHLLARKLVPHGVSWGYLCQALEQSKPDDAMKQLAAEMAQFRKEYFKP